MSLLKRDIVYLNGPPRSGKDEVAKLMTMRYGFYHMKFADTIKNITCAALSINRKELEDWKDQHQSVIGMTIREFLIWLSEEIMKPKFGADIMGRFTAEAVHGVASERIIFSDNGFFDEFRPIALANYAGTNLVLELHRPQHDFREDSRSYWYEQNLHDAKRLAKFGVINNDRDVRHLRAIASRKICKALNIEWVEEWTPLE